MRFKKTSLFLTGVLFITGLTAQVGLQTVVPLSPNAAAIAKYGETPIGHFTGVPNISVPIYTIQSRELSLPLQLSYHAGGNKVEEIASWVGLGWSLGSLPSISRQVNHVPDEGTGGYFYEYNGYTIKDVYDSTLASLEWETNWNTLVGDDMETGEYDQEADIFFFSLPGKSGKFYWNQELERFVTTPFSNIKITRNPGFKIVDEDGTIYTFEEVETAQTNGSQAGPIITNTWHVDKIYNANKTDSIAFTYGLMVTTSTSINLVQKGLLGSVCPTPPSYLSTTYNTSKRVSAITFCNGVVQFNLKDTLRQDLDGGYALDNIVVKNSDSQFVKKTKFVYSYRGTGSCTGATTYDAKRLFLKEVLDVDANNIEGQKHAFLYDSAIAIPCRNSPQQDYWGYFNGASGNIDLIPSMTLLPGVGAPIHLSGANRNVNPTYNQFGILKRITYPTGGNTDFEYESNTARNVNLPYNYETRIAYLEGEAPNPITTNTYIDTFTINNISDLYLNQNQGGAFLTANIGDYGCDLSGGGNSCAVFTIQGIDPWNSSYYAMVLPNNVQNWHVPNGRYEIKAVFSQSPPEYGGFFFIVSWYALDSSQVPLNRYVGGLRIKSMTTYPTQGTSMFRRFKYTNEYASDTSSGDVFGKSYFIAIDYLVDEETSQSCTQAVVGPNMPSITHSGSYIGYKRVFEEYDTTGVNGMTQYDFTFTKDQVFDQPPYRPPVSNEDFRGQPLAVKQFRRQGNNFYPVSKTSYEYPNETFDSLATWCYRIRYRDVDGGGPTFSEFYTLTPTWSQMSKKTERTYDQLDTTRFSETITDYSYHPNRFQLTQSKFVDSKGDTIKTKTYYPEDVTATGAAETARQSLLTQNRVSSVLKHETLNNATVTQEVKTNYKHFGNIVMPEEVFQKTGSNASESRVKFSKYASTANLISQQKTNDATVSYIWDYNYNYPIAEATNADSASIAHTSFEADGKGNWTFTGATSMHPSAATGLKGYSLSNGNITKSGLTSSVTYTITFWKRDSAGTISVSAGSGGSVLTRNGWALYRYELTGATSFTISGTAYIDELRLHPKNAHMRTIAYMPLIGIVTECDMNNRIVRYEYDGFNRLKLIKDDDGRILKRLDYKYQASYQQ